jgi:hypothetical protein
MTLGTTTLNTIKITTLNSITLGQVSFIIKFGNEAILSVTLSYCRVRVGQIFEFVKVILILKTYLGGG